VSLVVKAFDFSQQDHSGTEEEPRCIHQQAYQALIKIYVRLVIAQSIQLSNIVLVSLC